MLRGKMTLLALVVVFVGMIQPMDLLGQVEGFQKVKLTRVNSHLVTTDVSGEYSGEYKLEWGVFEFDGQGWAKVDESKLVDYTFTPQVQHRRTNGWTDLKTGVSGFSYTSENPEKFIEPVKFRVIGKQNSSGSNPDMGSEEASPLVKVLDDSLGKPGIKPSSISLWQWFFMPYINYIFGFDRIDAESQHEDDGFLVQAKRAIDNSGLIGRGAASIIGLIGNVGFLFFIWGNFLVHREAKWGDVSSDYKIVLDKWRGVIAIINSRIKHELFTTAGLNQEKASLRVWKMRENDRGNVPVGGDDLDEFSLGSESTADMSGLSMLDELYNEFDSLAYFDGSDKRDKKKSIPTFRILEAGLKNMVNNGMNWEQASEEVDRAMDARSSQELNYLRRKSVMEFLHFGAGVTPLLGLLGTVTGISQAFLKLGGDSGGGGILEPSQVIGQLAPAINEALWTTVLGLIASIFLMLGFYLMDSRFDALESKWDQLFVSITEDL